MKKIFPILFLLLFLSSHNLFAQNKLVGDWVIMKYRRYLPPASVYNQPEPNTIGSCSVRFIGLRFQDSIYQSLYMEYPSNGKQGLGDSNKYKIFYEIIQSKKKNEITVKPFTYNKRGKKNYPSNYFQITFIKDDVLKVKFYDGSGSVKRYRLYRKK